MKDDLKLCQRCRSVCVSKWRGGELVYYCAHCDARTDSDAELHETDDADVDALRARAEAAEQRAEAAEAEVAHLRERLAQARAEGEAAGRAAERAAAAAYLRERHALRHYAGCIERGEHVGAAGGAR